MFRKIASCLCVSFMLGTAVAQARPVVLATMTQAIVTKDAQGHVAYTALVAGVPLKPGTVVKYTVVATNSGADPALNMKPSGRIPFATKYDAGSASSDVLEASPEFTIDSGKTWARTPMVKVQTPQGMVERAATADAFTAVRWSVAKSLPAHSKATFSYEVIVK